MKPLTVSKDSKTLHPDVTKGFVELGWKFKFTFWINRNKPDVCKMTMRYDDKHFYEWRGSTVAACMEQLIEEFVEVV